MLCPKRKSAWDAKLIVASLFVLCLAKNCLFLIHQFFSWIMFTLAVCILLYLGVQLSSCAKVQTSKHHIWTRLPFLLALSAFLFSSAENMDRSCNFTKEVVKLPPQREHAKYPSPPLTTCPLLCKTETSLVCSPSLE